MSESYVYILTNKRHGTLYIGCTTDLIRRIYQHKVNIKGSFTAKYNVNKLIYYELHGDIMEAARRERRFKNWPRQWKINLIQKFNPDWKDLYDEICG